MATAFHENMMEETSSMSQPSSGLFQEIKVLEAIVGASAWCSYIGYVEEAPDTILCTR